MKLISILMPVYNVEKFVTEAIESILNQTYENFELIIIDDCSTDRTANIVKDYSMKDSRVIYLQNEQNLKIVKSLNRGLKICKGEYICRMDGDDISELDRLEKKVEFLENNPSIDLVGCSVLAINEEGKQIGKNKMLDNERKIRKTIKYSSPVLHLWMARKSVYDSIGLYREIKYVEDYDFLLRVIKKGFRVTNLSEYYGYKVRNRDGNTQSTVGIYQRKAHRYCYKLFKKENVNNIMFNENDFERFIYSTEKEISQYRSALIFLLESFATKNRLKKIYLLIKSYVKSKEQRKYMNRRIMYKIMIKIG